MIEVKEIHELNEELIKEIHELKSQLSDKHHMMPKQYHKAVSNPSTTIIGAFNDEQLIGVAIMNRVITFSTTIGDIDDVVVLDSYRGKGVATKILDAIVELAKAQGIYVLRLTSAPSREAANALYQRYGFTLRDTNSYRYLVK